MSLRLLSLLLSFFILKIAFTQNQNRAVELHDLGYIKYLNKEYKLSIDFYTQSIGLDSNLIVNYLDRGMAYKENGQFLEAERDFKKVITRGGKITYQGYNNLGNLYRNQKKYNEAIRLFNEAIVLNANCYECFYNRAVTLEILNKPVDAMKDYSAAIKLNTSYSNAFYNRGNLKFANKDFNGAIEDFTSALTLNPKNKNEVYYNRGMCYISIKKYKEAKSDFEQYLKSDKTNSDAYYNVAVCCYYISDYSNACKYANESLKLGNTKAKSLIAESCK